MFYCDPCAEEHKYPQSIGKTSGKCEVCGKDAICNNVHHSFLPEKEEKEPDIVISIYEVGSSEINLPLEPLEDNNSIAMGTGDKIVIISKKVLERNVDNIDGDTIITPRGKIECQVYAHDWECKEDGYVKLAISEEFIKVNIDNGIFKKL